MFNKSLLFTCALLSIALFSCQHNTNSSNYYIKYKLDGAGYNYDNQTFFAGCSDSFEVGGWCMNSTINKGSRVTINFKHKITKNDILALGGKKFYFDGANNSGLDANFVDFVDQKGFSYLYAAHTTDHAYYLQINSVSFLENNGMFNIYKVSGTFQASVEYDNYTPSIFKDATDGDFNMMWSSFY